MARYQGHVVVFRAKAPFETTGSASVEVPMVNFIDPLAARQWKSLGIAPSELCADSEFIRRSGLDVMGTLPTAEETKAFVADADPDKRAKLIDRLLERPEYASYFATKWADVLRDNATATSNFSASFRFHAWIRDSIAKNLPYDRFVRSILAANGTPETTPTVHWYRQLRTPDAFVDDTAQVSSACDCNAPSATITRSRNGVRTITTASRPISPRRPQAFEHLPALGAPTR